MANVEARLSGCFQKVVLNVWCYFRRSRDVKAALTRGTFGGEVGADVCFLGIHGIAVPFVWFWTSRNKVLMRSLSTEYHYSYLHY